MNNKKNGVVSFKDDKGYVIRYYDCFDVNSSIDVETPLNLDVGDFVRTEYWQGFSYGYHIEKFMATEEDLRLVQNSNKYLDEISQNVCSYFRKLITVSRDIYNKFSSDEEMKTMFSDFVVLSDEEIDEVLSLLEASIKIMGTYSGSCKSSVWLESQIRLFHKHEDLSKIGKLSKAILPIIDGEISSGASTFDASKGANEVNFSIMNQAGNVIYNARLGISGVNSSHLDDTLNSEVVFLDEEIIDGVSAYEYFSNSPFNLLVSRIMNRKDYEKIVTAMNNYKFHENNIDKYLSAIKVGVDYWILELLKPVFSVNDIAFRSMCVDFVPNNSSINNKLSEDEVERFRECLSQLCLKEMMLKWKAKLFVDFGPCENLSLAATMAGINPVFPWKREVVIYRDEVELPTRVVMLEDYEDGDEEKLQFIKRI